MFVFARLKGQNGVVRELRSVMDFNSPYCVIFSRDGLALGHLEAVLRPGDWRKVHPEKVPYMFGFRNLERAILLNISEVSLGRLVAKDVGAVILELDLPLRLPVEMILGRTFLDHFKMTYDATRGIVSLDPARPKAAKSRARRQAGGPAPSHSRRRSRRPEGVQVVNTG